jgi:transposase
MVSRSGRCVFRPGLHPLVSGLHRDQDAATADLTLPYSSGVVEGHLNS